MTDIWFKHLSSTLANNGLTAYVWHLADDRMEWAGDTSSFFGSGSHDAPVSGQDFSHRINPQFLPERLAALHDMKEKNPVGDHLPGMRVCYKFRRADGSQIGIEETAQLFEDESGARSIRGFIRCADVADKAAPQIARPAAASVAAPERASMNFGRRHMIQKLDEWQSRHMSEGEGNNSLGYLLAAGIDRISMFNEAYGPRYTDELLEKVSQRLAQIVGPNALVQRLDGDVFCLFFPVAPHNEMAAVAKYILGNFQERPLLTSSGPAGVSLSVGGIQLDPTQKSDPAGFVVKAEMAMRSAKEQGRGCFVSYCEASDRAENNRLLISHGDQFLNALRDNRVKLAFQPIISADSREVSFHECLIRLIDEKGKIQSAGQFYPAIEKLGLSRLVDQFALRTAIHELALFPGLSLSVNVSPATLLNRAWLRGLVLALRDSPSIAKRLIIEVTESAVIDNPRSVTMVVNTLRDLGCRVALDDFGAGYTAFSQLKDLDLDIVKIDKSYVRGIGEDTNRLFVKTLQSLADGVDVETVGEGAETMGEADLLANDGIDYIQGYIYGFPQVERVWLPKDHSHRRILKGKSDHHTESDFDEDLNADMASLVTAS
ncbi:MAG: GGDEF domain-containing protein [Micavibrio aeruginosavorus]|uniref:GGDEF domain-containing protein n=1 Tax=Micavibrio aeruginosavorus TaxID=349221 RepID=A0A7T5UGC8_9BACT|nr:MAG: GGDEF domain-containing protein [Micavibrio aeruginosavorus]